MQHHEHGQPPLTTPPPHAVPFIVEDLNVILNPTQVPTMSSPLPWRSPTTTLPNWLLRNFYFVQTRAHHNGWAPTCIAIRLNFVLNGLLANGNRLKRFPIRQIAMLAFHHIASHLTGGRIKPLLRPPKPGDLMAYPQHQAVLAHPAVILPSRDTLLVAYRPFAFPCNIHLSTGRLDLSAVSVAHLSLSARMDSNTKDRVSITSTEMQLRSASGVVSPKYLCSCMREIRQVATFNCRFCNALVCHTHRHETSCRFNPDLCLYTCRECGKNFTRAGTLREHMAKCSEPAPPPAKRTWPSVSHQQSIAVVHTPAQPSRPRIVAGSGIASDIEKAVRYLKNICKEEETYVSRGCGWTLQSVNHLQLRVNKLDPLRVLSYSELPESIMKEVFSIIRELKDRATTICTATTAIPIPIPIRRCRHHNTDPNPPSLLPPPQSQSKSPSQSQSFYQYLAAPPHVLGWMMCAQSINGAVRLVQKQYGLPYSYIISSREITNPATNGSVNTNQLGICPGETAKRIRRRRRPSQHKLSCAAVMTSQVKQKSGAAHAIARRQYLLWANSRITMGNARAGEVGDPWEDPLTNGSIAQHCSHVRGSEGGPTGNRARIDLMRGKHSNHCAIRPLCLLKPMGVKRDYYVAASERKGERNGKHPRKPAEKRHSTARLLHAKIREQPRQELNPIHLEAGPSGSDKVASNPSMKPPDVLTSRPKRIKISAITSSVPLSRTFQSSDELAALASTFPFLHSVTILLKKEHVIRLSSGCISILKTSSHIRNKRSSVCSAIPTVLSSSERAKTKIPIDRGRLIRSMHVAMWLVMVGGIDEGGKAAGSDERRSMRSGAL
ncbi:hypothetical protein PR048_010174 [Dryococelus australis]|uniref:C2H2-type domain-containing protein n=1 Tax=Dryococelus australis TaxID=614101 RepID=A0ABQ9I319_9NEOP|nr:hypothetical protein PR048_010174 [Dryococelus australis]